MIKKANKETYLRSILLKRVAFKEYEAYIFQNMPLNNLTITHIMININMNNYHQKILKEQMSKRTI